MGSELGGPLVVPMSPLPLLQESPTFGQRQARRFAAPLGLAELNPPLFQSRRSSIRFPLKNELFRWTLGMSLSAVLPSTSAPRQKHLHARLARAHALCSTGGGTAPAGPGCLGTEASTFPHSPQTHTVRTLSNTPRPQLQYFFPLIVSVHLPRHANARQDERLHPAGAGMQCPGDDRGPTWLL